MAALESIPLRLVKPEWSAAVPSPAHDALTAAERRQHLFAHPHSYLAVTRSPEDAPPGETWTVDDLLQAGRTALEELLLANSFSDVRPAQLYVYQLSLGGWTQTGVLGGLSVADYEADRIRVHEQVYPHRAEHLASHAAVVRAQSSPIAVAHRPHPEVSKALQSIVLTKQPLLDFQMDDGLIQRVWTVDPESANTIRAALDLQTFYLIDGHHRAAAALLHHRRGGDGLMLGVAFAADQLQNSPFHRIITGPPAKLMMAHLAGLPGARLTNDGTQPHPAAASTIEFVSRGEWITVPTSPYAETPLERLDTWHFEHSIRPELGEVDVDYVAGKRPISELIQHTDELDGVLALMTAVEMADLLAIADEGHVMPPKSTYFEPKVRSGVFLREL